MSKHAMYAKQRIANDTKATVGSCDPSRIKFMV